MESSALDSPDTLLREVQPQSFVSPELETWFEVPEFSRSLRTLKLISQRESEFLDFLAQDDLEASEDMLTLVAREQILTQVFPTIPQVVEGFVQEYFTAEAKLLFERYRLLFSRWLERQSLPQLELDEVPDLLATDSHPKLCAGFIDPLRSQVGSKVMKIVDMRGSLHMGHIFNDSDVEYSKRVLYRDFFYSSFTEWTNPLSFFQDVYLSLTRFSPEVIQEAFTEFPALDLSSTPDFFEATDAHFGVRIPALASDILQTLQSSEFVTFLADLHKVPSELRDELDRMTLVWTSSTDDQAFALAIAEMTQRYPDCMSQLWAFHQHYLECAIRLQIVFGAKNGDFHKRELPSYPSDLEKMVSILIVWMSYQLNADEVYDFFEEHKDSFRYPAAVIRYLKRSVTGYTRERYCHKLFLAQFVYRSGLLEEDSSDDQEILTSLKQVFEKFVYIGRYPNSDELLELKRQLGARFRKFELILQKLRDAFSEFLDGEVLGYKSRFFSEDSLEYILKRKSAYDLSLRDTWIIDEDLERECLLDECMLLSRDMNAVRVSLRSCLSASTIEGYFEYGDADTDSLENLSVISADHPLVNPYEEMDEDFSDYLFFDVPDLEKEEGDYRFPENS